MWLTFTIWKDVHIQYSKYLYDKFTAYKEYKALIIFRNALYHETEVW